MSKESNDSVILFLMLAAFLGWHLYTNHAQVQKLEQTVKIYQEREARTDETINNLRGF